ncbi:MAG TPA: succinate--CoA ligase subunit alpha [Chloroflexota bacterium]|nr:succinate--CoA ligase subunit alpha [Chloroflexota bacterium]
MSILVNDQTRVLVQGITGREGEFHTRQMLQYGTKVVSGVTPGRGGKDVAGVPVFDTVAEAVEKTRPNCSIIFVPAPFAADAIREAVANEIPLVIAITEGVPVHDMIPLYHYVRDHGVTLIGPNCPGLISPGTAKVGIMPAHIHRPGSVGVVSRSGTLTYEVVAALTARGYGQSSAVGIGGDPIVGTSFVDALELFQNDPQTRAIVLIGEIGGDAEEQAAEFIKARVTKPVVGFIAGRTAPPGRRMGHAGAIISGSSGTASEKMAALRAAGVEVLDSPDRVGEVLTSMNVARDA